MSIPNDLLQEHLASSCWWKNKKMLRKFAQTSRTRVSEIKNLFAIFITNDALTIVYVRNIIFNVATLVSLYRCNEL